MAQILDEKTRGALATYLANIRSLANESAKTHRFPALIGELFPASKASAKFADKTLSHTPTDETAGCRPGAS